MTGRNPLGGRPFARGGRPSLRGLRAGAVPDGYYRESGRHRMVQTAGHEEGG